MRLIFDCTKATFKISAARFLDWLERNFYVAHFNSNDSGTTKTPIIDKQMDILNFLIYKFLGLRMFIEGENSLRIILIRNKLITITLISKKYLSIDHI